jgi:protein phosphatase
VSGSGELRCEVASASDIGLVRERNEDAFGEASVGAGRLFVVADGMGGHAGGATASRLAVRTIEEVFTSAGGAPGERLRAAVVAANQRIHELASRDRSLAGMGTTAVALAIQEGRAWVANVGDSRVYRLRGGDLEQLTRDHSVVAELVRRGALTEAQARVHPRRNEVLRSLGSWPEVEVDLDEVEVAPGDVFLLCSDGLSGVVDDEAFAAFLSDSSPEEACRSLIEAAIGQGAPDNVTLQVVRISAA